MNKERRKRLSNIAGQLESLKGELEDIQSEEQESFDAMPESLQNSERGESSQTAISELDDAIGHFDDLVDAVERAGE